MSGTTSLIGAGETAEQAAARFLEQLRTFDPQARRALLSELAKVAEVSPLARWVILHHFAAKSAGIAKATRADFAEMLAADNPIKALEELDRQLSGAIQGMRVTRDKQGRPHLRIKLHGQPGWFGRKEARAARDKANAIRTT